MTVQITPFSTTPSRQNPATFSEDRDTRFSEENSRIAQMNAMSTELNALATAMTLNATSSTSTTSLTIGDGSKSLTVDTGKSYWPGMYVLISNTSNPGKWMHGYVTTYSAETGALVVTVTETAGTGTLSSWNVTLSAPQGIAGLPGSNAWTQTTAFTATPASTSTLTMTEDLTALIIVGMSLKYVIGGTAYYGQVSAITSNLLTVRGAPLSGDVTALYYGGGTVRQMTIVIPGLYEDASNTALIASDLASSIVWELPKSYVVFYKVYSAVHDTGTHGQASVRVNGTEVNTTTGGLTIAADATWYSTGVNISTSAYDINPGESLEVTSVKNGNGDAQDLTVHIVCVTP